MVAATAALGVRFVNRDAASDTISLFLPNSPGSSSSGQKRAQADDEEKGRTITLRVIETFDYTTARKRMG